MNKILLTAILSSGIVALALIWLSTIPHGLTRSLLNFSTFKRSSIIGMGLIFTLASALFFPIPDNSIDGMLTTTGLIAFGFGFVLAVSAKMEMNHVWGAPAQHDIKRQSILIKTGPFSVSRNPIYVGLLLVFFGFALAIKSYGILFGFYYVYLVHKAVKKEEQLLEQYFGMEYVAYKSKVPRFIPFFWR